MGAQTDDGPKIVKEGAVVVLFNTGVTVLGAQTVDGPEEANGGAFVGTLLPSGSLVALLFWVLGSDS